MSKLSEISSALDVGYGNSPDLDALLLHFMTENNLEYSIDPMKNASAEQVRFMVALEEEAFYAPCSDWMFLDLLKQGLPDDLKREYTAQWRELVRLVRKFVSDRYLRRRIISLCRHKFRLALSSPIIIPSRLMKRMITMFMTQSGLDDPYRRHKRLMNQRANEILDSPEFDRAVNRCPDSHPACKRIGDLRFELDCLELERLIKLSTISELWEVDENGQSAASLDNLDELLASVDGECEEGFAELRTALDPERNTHLKILYLPLQSGGIVFDLEIINSLIRQGHKVVLALKEGFHFDAPTFWDVERDLVLTDALRQAYTLQDMKISKAELLRLWRHNQLIIISDGTRENFNPYRTSVTLARAWKEADIILAKGEDKYRRLVQTSHDFTRDIFCFFRDTRGKFHLHFEPKAKWVRKFSEEYILSKAESIIAEMQSAKSAGNAVMFYSGIIGSVPGQTKEAIEIMNTFIRHLRSRMDKVYIVNPAEHFEEGMDADDLMFMWERVQRSGLLNVWRFQTSLDIEKSFELMNAKVPPIWTGKDSTYSTGCTKEMHIALDMQKKQPELQIIGPNPENFFRRREYGVGKFCDVAIDEC